MGHPVLRAGKQAIPDNEVNLAADLYAALNDFYAKNSPHFDDRPLIVTGESYAGGLASLYFSTAMTA